MSCFREFCHRKHPLLTATPPSPAALHKYRYPNPMKLNLKTPFWKTWTSALSQARPTAPLPRPPFPWGTHIGEAAEHVSWGRQRNPYLPDPLSGAGCGLWTQLLSGQTTSDKVYSRGSLATYTCALDKATFQELSGDQLLLGLNRICI